MLAEQHRYRESEAAYRRALALKENLTKDFPAVVEYRHDLAKSQRNLGLLLKDRRRPREAEETVRRQRSAIFDFAPLLFPITDRREFPPRRRAALPKIEQHGLARF